ncbi:MAG: hypothetical protein Q7S59_01365 [Sulfurimonas sp.]|nr:hypothetical protein [Sulfurimonas sp.]
MKSIIISLIAVSCLIQGCGDEKNTTHASAVAGDSSASAVVSSQVANENAINAPTLPDVSNPLPTENIKNLSK